MPTKYKRKEQNSRDRWTENIPLEDESDTPETWDENECAGCGESYSETAISDDWVRCVLCSRWLHETCIKYDDMCNRWTTNGNDKFSVNYQYFENTKSILSVVVQLYRLIPG